MKLFELNPYYGIEKDGRVYSYYVNRYLHIFTSKIGYKQIMLSIDGKPKMFLVHRIVALTYLPNPNNYPDVNHKDTNKSNNHVSNLEWTTKSNNTKHAWANGLMENSKRAKIEALGKKVLCIETQQEFESARAASRHLGKSTSYVSHCIRNNQKANGLTFIYI